MLQAQLGYLARLSEKENAQGQKGPIEGFEDELPTCGVLWPEKCMDELRDFSCLVSQLIHPYSVQRALFSWLGAKRCSDTG